MTNQFSISYFRLDVTFINFLQESVETLSVLQKCNDVSFAKSLCCLAWQPKDGKVWFFEHKGSLLHSQYTMPVIYTALIVNFTFRHHTLSILC